MSAKMEMERRKEENGSSNETNQIGKQKDEEKYEGLHLQKKYVSQADQKAAILQALKEKQVRKDEDDAHIYQRCP